MRRVSMATRDELIAAVINRYGGSDRREKTRILDEFVAVTGFHRKHAMRLLRGRASRRWAARPGRRIYDDDVREALVLVWEASDRVCGKRLKPLIQILVEAMERHGHLKLAPEVGVRLLSMSAATIDRALREVREKAGRNLAPAASSIIRRSIPIRTFSDWRDSATRLCRSRSCGAQRPIDTREFCSDVGSDRCRHRVDGVRAVAGSRARGFEVKF